MAALRWGSTSPEVEQAQRLLKQAGYYYYGPVDGKFGPLTYFAVGQFQEANGLVVDGIVGPQTMAALTADASPSPTPSGDGGTVGSVGVNAQALAARTPFNTV